MNVSSIKTKIYSPEQDLIDFILDSAGAQLREGSLLAVTSKIVSLADGQLVKVSPEEKKALIQKESDHYLGEIGYGCHLTIKDGLFIASAGIDESNSATGEYILYPREPYKWAQKIQKEISTKLNLRRLGVLLTDSHTIPLRRGVVGVTLSYWGFKATRSLIGQPDLFGRELKMTKQDVVDALSAAAVLLMGEGADSCPLALIEDAPVDFCAEVDPCELSIPLEEDLYYPIYKNLMSND